MKAESVTLWTHKLYITTPSKTNNNSLSSNNKKLSSVEALTLPLWQTECVGMRLSARDINWWFTTINEPSVYTSRVTFMLDHITSQIPLILATNLHLLTRTCVSHWPIYCSTVSNSMQERTNYGPILQRLTKVSDFNQIETTQLEIMYTRSSEVRVGTEKLYLN